MRIPILRINIFQKKRNKKMEILTESIFLYTTDIVSSRNSLCHCLFPVKNAFIQRSSHRNTFFSLRRDHPDNLFNESRTVNPLLIISVLSPMCILLRAVRAWKGKQMCVVNWFRWSHFSSQISPPVWIFTAAIGNFSRKSSNHR